MFKSRIFGCNTCIRQKASNWRVSESGAIRARSLFAACVKESLIGLQALYQ